MKLSLMLRSLFRRNAVERDLTDEIEDHIESEIADRIRRGETPEQARRGALVAFGGVEYHKEQTRDARGVRPLEDLFSDIRYALPSLRRNPGFTTACVLVLGLGLGAATAAFSVIDRVLLSELPYADSEQLVEIHEQAADNRWNISTVDVLAVKEQNRTLAEFGAVSWAEMALSGAGRRGPARPCCSPG